MKSIVNIYQKIFMQVWIFVLSTLIFVCGILLLTDLKNYKYVITEGYAPTYVWNVDEYGKTYVNVHINCKAKLMYVGDIHNLPIMWFGYEVSSTSGYEAKSDGIYLDIYETKNGELVLLETLKTNTYSKNFYDLEYGEGIKIKPRLENVKYEYPKWRIYVPIILFILTVPMMALSVYLIVLEIIDKVKRKKESEMPIYDKYKE